MTAYIDNLLPEEVALAAQLSEELAASLERAGWLRTTMWRQALDRVPRHHFVPSFRLPSGLGGGTFDGRPAEGRRQWLQKVYAGPDHTLLTEFDRNGVVSSSCSAPSMVIAMLEALEVGDGESVLEIGTGSGWNAGLLAACLGDSLVTSIDITAELVDHARQRLDALDLHPMLIVGDGYAGYPHRAPYDRIIATCAVRQVPGTWLSQTRPGGFILTDTRGSIGGALARIEAPTDGVARGRFLNLPFGLMPMRGPTTPYQSIESRRGLFGPAVTAPGDRRATPIDSSVMDSQEFRFVAQLHLPGCTAATVRLVDGSECYCLVDPTSRSWARRHSDGDVVQGGNRRLWDDLERAYVWWLDQGRPPPHRFRLVVEPGGMQRVALACPAISPTWQLPL